MPEELEQILAEHNENPATRLGQKRLGYEVTKVVHGETAAKQAEKLTAFLFGDGKIDDLTSEDLDLLAQSFPTAATGATLVDILVATGLASSKGEARKLISGNAISVNGVKVTADQIIDSTSVIKKGKNKFAIVR
jgi:tyrosyl-tRNA synthetase